MVRAGVLSGAGWRVAADGVWYPGTPSPRSASAPLAGGPPPPTGPSFGDHVKKAALAIWAAFRRLPARTQGIIVGAAALVVLALVVVAAITSPDTDQDTASTPSDVGPAATATPDDAEAAAPTESSAPTTSTTEGPSAQIELAAPAVAIEDATSVDIAGSTAPGTAVTAEWSGGEATATAGSQGNFIVTIDGLETEGPVDVTLHAEAPGGDTDEASVTITRTISESSFKFFTRRIPFDELVRDPDGLIGETVNYRARVLQYDSRTTTASMLVYVTEEDFGFWTDNVLVTLNPSLGATIDNDDIIDVWGTVTGTQTYDTAIGGSNTVPMVEARYMTLVAKE